MFEVWDGPLAPCLLLVHRDGLLTQLLVQGEGEGAVVHPPVDFPKMVVLKKLGR